MNQGEPESSEPLAAGGRELWSSQPAPLLVLIRCLAQNQPKITHTTPS